MIRKILLLGDPGLYEISSPVQREELCELSSIIEDLHDTLFDYREKHRAGRAIAAPQIGVKKRLIYSFIEKPVVFINPSLEFPDEEMMTVTDDCMSFPGLLVKVRRHRRCTVRYLDLDWKPCSLALKGDLSEMLQHEYDHLDGILAIMRAIDGKSFFLKNEDKL